MDGAVLREMREAARMQAILTKSFRDGLEGIEAKGADMITAAWVSSGALQALFNRPTDHSSQSTPSAPTTEDEWLVWASSFKEGLKPIFLSNSPDGYIPFRTINAIVRGAEIVARNNIREKKSSWDVPYEYGFIYGDRFVSGFDEWVKLILNGSLRLDNCRMVGKKYVDVFRAQLRAVYGKK